jgi:hypothetical protein
LFVGLALVGKNQIAADIPCELRVNCDAVQDVPFPTTEVEPWVSVTVVGVVVHE